MAISGLMVTLGARADAAEQALHAIATDPRLTLGRRAGRCLPVVAETASAEHDAQLWNDLSALPGIESVDVTFVSIDAESVGISEASSHGRA